MIFELVGASLGDLWLVGASLADLGLVRASRGGDLGAGWGSAQDIEGWLGAWSRDMYSLDSCNFLVVSSWFHALIVSGLG